MKTESSQCWYSKLTPDIAGSTIKFWRMLNAKYLKAHKFSSPGVINCTLIVLKNYSTGKEMDLR